MPTAVFGDVYLRDIRDVFLHARQRQERTGRRVQFQDIRAVDDTAVSGNYAISLNLCFYRNIIFYFILNFIYLLFLYDITKYIFLDDFYKILRMTKIVNYINIKDLSF